MFTLLVLVFVGLSSAPYPEEPTSCEYYTGKLCCTWTIQEVGCTEIFETEEYWCIDLVDNTWVKHPSSDVSTWYDRYIEDHCRNCPECCVTVPTGEYGENPNTK